MNLFGKKTEVSKTGVYSVNGKKLTPLNEEQIDQIISKLQEARSFLQ